MDKYNIKNKRAIYVEARKALAVVIEDVVCSDEYVEISISAIPEIFHLRSWENETPYISRDTSEIHWTLGCAQDLIVVRDDFMQGPMSGWQLLIDEKTVERFASKDDSWVDDWF